MDANALKKSNRVQITPHMVSVLIAIETFSERDKPHPIPIIGGTLPTTANDVRWTVLERRRFAKSALAWVQGHDEEYTTFETKVKKISSALAEMLTQRLTEICSSEPLKLADFFESLGKLLDSRNGEAPLHRQSILGMFVRRMVLQYDKLTFSRTIKLYKDLKEYFHSSMAPSPGNPSTMTPGNHLMMTPGNPSMINDDNASGMEVSMGLDETPMSTGDLGNSLKPSEICSRPKLSQRQAESFISEHAARLQCEDPTAPPPDQLQEDISNLYHRSPHLLEVHYLTYLNCLRLKEFSGAIHSLHKYFDQLTQKTTNQNTETEGGNSTEEWTHSFRYAALNIVSLHYRLGHTNEAVLALQEAIQKAQEANDHVCLQHAMSWLYRLQHGEDIDLGHTIAKSEELNLPYLTSLAVQNLAKQKALSSAKPIEVFEFLSRSDALNCQHQQPQLVSVSQAQQSSLWNMYGYRFMSSLSDHFLLNSATSDGIGSSSRHIPDTESFCLTLCNQARIHFNAGKLDLAKEFLQCAEENLPPLTEHSKIWMLCEQQFSFQLSVLQGKFSEAQKAVESIVAINQSESSYCNCLLLAMEGEVSKCIEGLSDLIQSSQKTANENTLELLPRCLLLLSAVYLMQGEPTTAIPHLLECVALCHQRHQSYMLAVATAHIAYAQLLMKMPEKAMSLLEEVLPHILANGSLYVQSCIKFVMVQCQCDGTREQEDLKTAYLPGAQLLNEVSENFRLLGAEYKARDVAYYQAHLYHQSGYTSERNKSAMQFRELDRLYPASSFPPMKVLWPPFL